MKKRFIADFININVFYFWILLDRFCLKKENSGQLYCYDPFYLIYQSPYLIDIDQLSLTALSKKLLSSLWCALEESGAFLEVPPPPLRCNFSIILTWYLAPFHSPLKCSQKTWQWPCFLWWQKPDTCQFNLSFLDWTVFPTYCLCDMSYQVVYVWRIEVERGYSMWYIAIICSLWNSTNSLIMGKKPDLNLHLIDLHIVIQQSQVTKLRYSNLKLTFNNYLSAKNLIRMFLIFIFIFVNMMSPRF